MRPPLRSDDPGPLERAGELAFLVAAVTLLVANGARIAMIQDSLSWWALAAASIGMAMADLTSGLVHWTADSWGSETWPLIGRRFLRPFRVHGVRCRSLSQPVGHVA